MKPLISFLYLISICWGTHTEKDSIILHYHVLEFAIINNNVKEKKLKRKSNKENKVKL